MHSQGALGWTEMSLEVDDPRAMKVGALCVLYGNSELPQLLRDLSATRGVYVSILDNSGDMIESVPVGVAFARPGRNLGYSAGVNGALAALPSNIDVLLVINPDIVSDVACLLGLARQVADMEGPALVAPTSEDGTFGIQPGQSVASTIIQHTFRRNILLRDRTNGFLSGALLAINTAALDLLVSDGRLLQENLFFMDDVELSARARRMGVRVRDVHCRGSIRHVAGASMRRRPSVRIYFSRVSKVRYWSQVQPLRAKLLAAYFLLESSVGWLVAACQTRRLLAREGATKGEGFKAVVQWLLSRDDSIDQVILGNVVG
jgi:GT2 family glycosyltransferase